MESFIKFIIPLKNGYMAKKSTIILSKNNFFLSLCEKLKDYKFIKNFSVIKNKIEISLLYYENNKTFINCIKIFSKSTLSKFFNYKKIKKNFDKYKIYFITTTQGLKTSKECIKSKIGGKLLFAIW